MNNQKKVPPASLLLKSGLCALSVVVGGVLISGCDGGSSGSSSSGSSSLMSAEAKIKGSVSDFHGPSSQGQLEVKDKNDKVIGRARASCAASTACRSGWPER